MENVRRSGLVDGIGFIVVVAVGFFVTIHGKALAYLLFGEGPRFAQAEWEAAAVYAASLSLAVLLQAVRTYGGGIDTKASLTMFLTIAGPFVLQAAAYRKSALVFILQLYLLAVASSVAVIEPLFERNMSREFWKILLDGILKAVRYILLLFTAGIAIVRFIADSGEESVDNFLTTLFYPTLLMMISLGLIFRWILVPSLEQVLVVFEEGGEENSVPEVGNHGTQNSALWKTAGGFVIALLVHRKAVLRAISGER